MAVLAREHPRRAHARPAILAAALGGVLGATGCTWDWVSRAGDGGPEAGDGDADVAADPCEAHPGALFCDGFESGDLAKWTELDSNTITVVDDAHRGEYAGRGAVPNGDTISRVQAEWAPAVTAGPLHVRFFVRIPVGSTVEQVSVLSLGDDDGRIALVARTASGTVGGTYVSSNLPNGGSGDGSEPEHLTLGAWECLELAVEVADAPNGTITVLRNGTAFTAGNRTAVNTLPAGGYTSLRLPIIYSGQPEPFEILVDDVVVDDAPIGCD